MGKPQKNIHGYLKFIMDVRKSEDGKLFKEIIYQTNLHYK